MEYRITKHRLLDRIGSWDAFLKRKVRLIACGGTALTLLGIKASTKDVDLIVPDLKEYEYLVGLLKELGYESASGSGWKRGEDFIFDLFRGKTVHTTELLESPLEKDNHMPVKEFVYIYLGVLNYYDIIISKLFRYTAIDRDDCLELIKNKRDEIDIKRLEKRFRETASYDTSEEKANKYIDDFLKILGEKKLK